MRIIAKRTLREFWILHGNAEGPLKAWHAEARVVSWRRPADIKARYASASILRGNRVVFNIGGNKYRLIVEIHYASEIVFIRFVGTHQQYDAIDAEVV